MRIDGDKVIFSTGTERYANRGIIGLDGELSVSEGYDGGFWEVGWKAPGTELTRDELAELADYMIALWTKFKKTHG